MFQNGNDRCLRSLKLLVDGEAGVAEKFKDGMKIVGGKINMTLQQGVTVNFTIQAELEDGHSFVIWRYSGFRTKNGEGSACYDS